jgi:hypothetical protein
VLYGQAAKLLLAGLDAKIIRQELHEFLKRFNNETAQPSFSVVKNLRSTVQRYCPP